MKDYSTMNTFEFLFSIAWKYVIGFIWYKRYCLKTLACDMGNIEYK